MNDPDYQEHEILISITEGDERAFMRFVEHHTPAVYSHVLTYLKDPFRAEEITQNVFLKIWQQRASFRTIGNFRGFLYIVTRNSTLSALREKLFSWDEAKKDDLPSDAMDPARAAEYAQLSKELDRAIEKLPPRRKEVFKLSRLENQTYDEIAARLQISKSAVNQHIVEALVFLRTYLRKRFPEQLVLLFFLIESLI